MLPKLKIWTNTIVITVDTSDITDMYIEIKPCTNSANIWL